MCSKKWVGNEQFTSFVYAVTFLPSFVISFTENISCVKVLCKDIAKALFSSTKAGLNDISTEVKIREVGCQRDSSECDGVDGPRATDRMTKPGI